MPEVKDLGLANNEIVSVQKTSGTGLPGSIDTYTITVRDGSTFTFNVTNGNNGTTNINRQKFTSLAACETFLAANKDNVACVIYCHEDNDESQYNTVNFLLGTDSEQSDLIVLRYLNSSGTWVTLSSAFTTGEFLYVYYFENSEGSSVVPTSRTIAGISLESDITENALFDKMNIKGRYATLSALQTANPNHGYCYLVKENNHWYYWNGAAWTDGGGYLSAGYSVPDTRKIAGNKLSADISEDQLRKSLYVDDLYPIAQFVATEQGTFNSNTGEETGEYTVARARTLDFIPENVKYLQSNTYYYVQLPVSGILLYAWDNAGNYIGFWGGSTNEWVTSGSVYLEVADMDYFRTQYPNYKFKAVTVSDNNLGFKNTIVAINTSSLNYKTVRQKIKFAILAQGLLGNNDDQITLSNSLTRVSTKENIDNRILEIIANDGYYFRIFAMNEDETTAGAYRTTNEFSLTGSSKNLTYFDLTKYNYYGYRLCILKEDDSAINIEEGFNALTFRTEKDNHVLNTTLVGRKISDNINTNQLRKSLYLNGINLVSQYPVTERGGFVSETGEKSDNSIRTRTADFIPDDIKYIQSNVFVDTHEGVLLYAWDNNDNYIGFWGGSTNEWVTSGSVYLEVVDMDYFRTQYPNYKFKAVAKTSSELGYDKIISCVSIGSFAQKVVKQNLKYTKMVRALMSNHQEELTLAYSLTRVSTAENIDSRVVEIVANEGYYFRIFAMNEDGTTAGSYRTTDQFSLDGSSKNLTKFNLSDYNYYGYRLCILKENDENINIDEALNAIVFRTERDITGSSNENGLTSAKVRYLPFLNTYNSESNNSMCLCAIKTPIVNNKMPMSTGFLFHKLPGDDKTLWFSRSIDGEKTKVCDLDYFPNLCDMAISPSGVIIGALRGNRGALHIYNGSNYTLFSSAATKPMGWLYNSGIEFFKDNNNVECCIFAEYDGSATDKGGFYVWKGKYPYTSESDWETVFHKDFSYSDPIIAGTITHFHMVRRDPFTNIIYLTSGDKVGQLNWWYSTDYGANWTLLISDTSSEYTWEDHVLRTINFIFTKDYIYWATDHGVNHCLNQISRDEQTGIIDLSTRVKLSDLPYAHACNSLCYVETPNGLFMYERIDIGWASGQGYKVPLLFWSFEKEKLINLGDLSLLSNTWGGHRGQCYINYTNGQQPYPAMGFASNTPCIFDIIGANGGNIETIFYDII